MTRSAVITVALACILTSAAVGDAIELSGIWVGKRKCTGFGTDHGKISVGGDESTLFIFQSGKLVSLGLDGFSPYRGLAIDDPTKLGKGHLGIVQCGTADTFEALTINEVGRMVVATKPSTGKATLRGTSIESYAFFQDAVLTCKWSYKRSSVSFPSVPNCFE